MAQRGQLHPIHISMPLAGLSIQAANGSTGAEFGPDSADGLATFGLLSFCSFRLPNQRFSQGRFHTQQGQAFPHEIAKGKTRLAGATSTADHCPYADTR